MISNVDINEVKDIHPILRANPFLVEEGAKLVQGEHFVGDDTLRRIDIQLKDSQGTPLYVEVEWSGLDPGQMERYQRSLEKRHAGKKFRLAWFIPEDLTEQAHRWVQNKGAPVDIKSFSRHTILRFTELRKKARNALDEVYKELMATVVPPRGLMYGEEISFPNIILACYFEGEVVTQKSRRKIGLRKQAIGRHFDLIRCICESNFSNTLPELSLILLYEILKEPYYYLTTDGSGVVDSKGIYNHIMDNRTSGYYSIIAKKAAPIYEAIESYVQECISEIMTLYGSNPTHCDLLYRVLTSLPPETYEMDVIVVKRLIEHLIGMFSLTPLKPIDQIRHSLANQWVKNVVKSEGYENDFAKRLIELAVLKRELIPISGLPVVEVLATSVREGKTVYTRVPAQNFRLNTDATQVRIARGF